jgi:hypothetical protein
VIVVWARNMDNNQVNAFVVRKVGRCSAFLSIIANTAKKQ